MQSSESCCECSQSFWLLTSLTGLILVTSSTINKWYFDKECDKAAILFNTNLMVNSAVFLNFWSGLDVVLG